MKTARFPFYLRRLLLSNVMIVSPITDSICTKNTAHDVTVLATFRKATATVMIFFWNEQSLEQRI